MNLTELKATIMSLAENDLSIADADITTWIDQGINRINQFLQCDIPRTKGQLTTYEPEFDERFHEVLVEFALMKYRESDADYNSAQYHLGQFNDMLMTMQRDMEIKPSQRKDFNVQQITADGQTTYTLSMPNGSYFDLITVYVNDAPLDSLQYRISYNNRTIIFNSAQTVGDKITIVFENNSDLNNAPYEWWKGW